jgi:hypothetical protein
VSAIFPWQRAQDQVIRLPLFQDILELFCIACIKQRIESRMPSTLCVKFEPTV